LRRRAAISAARQEGRGVYVGLYNLGVMAHYSGDASMPYHATSDFNGYSLGRGHPFLLRERLRERARARTGVDVLSAAREHRAR
jgi:hypothetical protein